jgi:AcrR family transcriptional regulator
MTATRLAPGRPRSDTSKTALIQATFEMLREVGFERMTIDAIAARAGVGKTTIYRWYSTKEDLVIEALSSVSENDQEFIPNTGKLASDLQAMIQHRMHQDPLCFNRQSCALTISALAGSPELAQTYWDLYISKKRAAYTKVFERAKKRGELAEDADLDLFLDLFHGHILFGLLIRPKGVVTPEVVGKAIKHLLAGFSPR